MRVTGSFHEEACAEEASKLFSLLQLVLLTQQPPCPPAGSGMVAFGVVDWLLAAACGGCCEALSADCCVKLLLSSATRLLRDGL